MTKIRFVEIITNFGYLMVLFVCLSALFAYIFHRMKLGKKGWRNVEIVFLTMSFVGVLGVSQRAETLINEIELEMQMEHLPYLKELISEIIEHSEMPKTMIQKIEERLNDGAFISLQEIQRFEELWMYVEEYNRTLASIQVKTQKLPLSGSMFRLIIFTPLIVTISIALRVSKTIVNSLTP